MKVFQEAQDESASGPGRADVVHMEDFKEHWVHAFLTMKDMHFIRESAPLAEADKI